MKTYLKTIIFSFILTSIPIIIIAYTQDREFFLDKLMYSEETIANVDSAERYIKRNEKMKEMTLDELITKFYKYGSVYYIMVIIVYTFFYIAWYDIFGKEYYRNKKTKLEEEALNKFINKNKK